MFCHLCNLVKRNNPSPITVNLYKTSVIYKFTCPTSNAYNKCQQQYNGITTTTLKRQITANKYNSSIKQHFMTDHRIKIKNI